MSFVRKHAWYVNLSSKWGNAAHIDWNMVQYYLNMGHFNEQHYMQHYIHL